MKTPISSFTLQIKKAVQSKNDESFYTQDIVLEHNCLPISFHVNFSGQPENKTWNMRLENAIHGLYTQVLSAAEEQVAATIIQANEIIYIPGYDKVKRMWYVMVGDKKMYETSFMEGFNEKIQSGEIEPAT